MPWSRQREQSLASNKTELGRERRRRYLRTENGHQMKMEQQRRYRARKKIKEAQDDR